MSELAILLPSSKLPERRILYFKQGKAHRKHHNFKRYNPEFLVSNP